MALVASYATRVIAIRKGAIVADGSPREVFAQSEILRTTNITPPPVSVLANQLGLPGVLTVTDAADAIETAYTSEPPGRSGRRAGDRTGR